MLNNKYKAWYTYNKIHKKTLKKSPKYLLNQHKSRTWFYFLVVVDKGIYLSGKCGEGIEDGTSIGGGEGRVSKSGITLIKACPKTLNL